MEWKKLIIRWELTRIFFRCLLNDVLLGGSLICPLFVDNVGVRQMPDVCRNLWLESRIKTNGGFQPKMIPHLVIYSGTHCGVVFFFLFVGWPWSLARNTLPRSPRRWRSTPVCSSSFVSKVVPSDENTWLNSSIWNQKVLITRTEDEEWHIFAEPTNFVEAPSARNCRTEQMDFWYGTVGFMVNNLRLLLLFLWCFPIVSTGSVKSIHLFQC